MPDPKPPQPVDTAELLRWSNDGPGAWPINAGQKLRSVAEELSRLRAWRAAAEERECNAPTKTRPARGDECPRCRYSDGTHSVACSAERPLLARISQLESERSAAAAELDELRRQVATLRAALEPFARVGARYPKGDDDRHMGYDLRTGDYRRAREALRADPTEPGDGDGK